MQGYPAIIPTPPKILRAGPTQPPYHGPSPTEQDKSRPITGVSVPPNDLHPELNNADGFPGPRIE